VIVEACYNLSKMLGHLTISENPDLPLLTLARSDEKSIPAHAKESKRKMALQISQEQVYPSARNFK
jgi:error-prone DNA polymerase